MMHTRTAGQLHTQTSLAADLRRAGLEQGMHVIVHASLKSLGPLSGGPVAVIRALMDVVTRSGTILMPTQSSNLSEPRHWRNPPVPRSWWRVMRRTMPAYEPAITPTLGMGVIPETFRKFPNVFRSRHPSHSFAAWGRRAEWIVSAQPFRDEMGPKSPLGKLHALDGRILLLGVDHGSNTTLHLAESLIAGWPRFSNGGPVLVHGRRFWKTWDEVDGDADRFPALGRAFERAHPVRMAKVGRATARLIPQRAIVDFAVPWLRRRLAAGA